MTPELHQGHRSVPIHGRSRIAKPGRSRIAEAAGDGRSAGRDEDGRMSRLREALAILAAPRAERERTVALLELFARE